MNKYLACIFIFFALHFGRTSTVAQNQPVEPDTALQSILRNLGGTPLSLDDAIRQAMENATAVRSAEGALMAAMGKARRERGAFDPELFFSLNYLDQQQPTASFFSGASILSTIQTTSRTGLRMNLPSGTELEASLNTTRLKTNSSFAFLNPQHTVFGSLSLRQPLLEGFQSAGRKELTQSEEELDAAQARYDQEILFTSAEVERTYWELYAAERDYAVQKLVHQQGQIFLKETELRTNIGLVGPNQVASAKTFLAEQSFLLLDREEELDRVSDRLASLIGARPESDKHRYATMESPPSDFPDVEVDELLNSAKQNNLELRAAQSDVEAARTQATAAGWQALPSVDLVGSLGGNGLGGTAQTVVFGGDTLQTTRGGSLGDAIRQTYQRDFPTWSVGVELTIPLGFRKGLGEKDRLDAEVSIAEQRYVEKVRSLEEQVRASYRELSHGKRRLAAAQEGVEAAQEQVRIGFIEFRNGRTTAFELVRLSTDFASSQQRYSDALVRTAKAATTLKQLTSGNYPASTSH